MITLNLISPSQKKLVNSIKAFQFLKNIAFILFSCTVVTATLFFFIYLLLQNFQQSLDSQLSKERAALESSAGTSVETAIKTLNDQLIMADSIQSSYVQWTSFLKALSEAVPDKIILNNLQINASTSSLRLAGIASDREALLSFQNQIKTFKYFSNLIFPISNLAQKENINFEITGQLAPALYGQP